MTSARHTGVAAAADQHDPQGDVRPGSLGRPSAQDQGTAQRNLLAADLGSIARSLEAEDDTEAMLDDLVATGVRLIPGAQAASISVVLGRRQVTSQHPSSDLARQVDALQSEAGEGPCLDAIYEQSTVRVPDLRHEQRWPLFAQRAYELGVGSMLSFQLYVEGDNLGSLNLYNHAADGFDDESEQVGLLFASHAAVAYADAKKIDGLARAIATRDLIGQAKGILMERYGIDADHAFAVLTRASQYTQLRLRDVAAELVSTRRLATLDPAPDSDA